MKSKKSLLVLALLIILPAVVWGSSTDPRSLGFATVAGQAGTNSNPHNLSNRNTDPLAIKAASTGDPYETQICVFCHTPHNATAESPLWNRPEPSRMGSFPTFDTNRVRVTNDLGVKELGIDDAAIIGTTKYDAADPDYPNGATKLCLSCHDGATAIGSLASGRNIAMESNQNYITDTTKFFDPPTNSALPFDRTHPVSFVYTQAVVTHLMTPTGSGGAGKTDTYKLPDHSLNPNSRTRLDSQYRMQCTTCHDPHLDTNDGGGYGLPFWRNAGVGLDETEDYNITCNECHATTLVSGGLHNL